MLDPVRELKIRARFLQRAAQTGDAAALARLRALPELRGSDDAALRQTAPRLRRKHCLATIARELGFESWEHARRIVAGDASDGDFGRVLYGKGWGAHLNHWFATYDEAHAHHASSRARTYLLAYARHFFVVESSFVEALGLDPADPDWEAIGWDWVRPRDPTARRRLYAKLLVAGRTLAA